MSDLALLVNSTDTALSSGGVSSPLASSAGDVAKADSAGNGFAGVLADRMQMEGSKQPTTVQPPPEPHASNSVPLSQSGDVHPVNGKPLPLITSPSPVSTLEPADSQVDPSSANAALLLAMVQSAPSVSVSPNSVLGNELASLPGQAIAEQARQLNAPLSLVENEQPMADMALSTQIPDTAALPPNVILADPNRPSVLTGQPVNQSENSNSSQGTQQANSTILNPTLLGKPISEMAQQALSRAMIDAGQGMHQKSIGPQGNALSSLGAMGQNNSQSAVLPGMNMAMRMDLLNATFAAATRDDANAILRSAEKAAPITNLIGVNANTEDASGLLSGIQRPSVSLGAGVAPTLTVSTPVGQPAWANELGQRVTWLANNELREAQLQLHPRSLGPIEVRIVYGHEQQLNVSFNAANPLARDALDAALPRLREMFEQQGLHLGDAGVSHQSFGEQQARNELEGQSVATDPQIEAENPELITSLPPPSQLLGVGLLDAFA